MRSLQDINEIEELNEFGELKDAVGFDFTLAKSNPSSATATAPTQTFPQDASVNDSMRDLAAQAANVALSKKNNPRTEVLESVGKKDETTTNSQSVEDKDETAKNSESVENKEKTSKEVDINDDQEDKKIGDEPATQNITEDASEVTFVTSDENISSDTRPSIISPTLQYRDPTDIGLTLQDPKGQSKTIDSSTGGAEDAITKTTTFDASLQDMSSLSPNSLAKESIPSMTTMIETADTITSTAPSSAILSSTSTTMPENISSSVSEQTTTSGQREIPPQIPDIEFTSIDPTTSGSIFSPVHAIRSRASIPSSPVQDETTTTPSLPLTSSVSSSKSPSQPKSPVEKPEYVEIPTITALDPNNKSDILKITSFDAELKSASSESLLASPWTQGDSNNTIQGNSNTIFTIMGGSNLISKSPGVEEFDEDGAIASALEQSTAEGRTVHIHRGSEVVEVSQEEIRRIEEESKIVEVAEEQEEDLEDKDEEKREKAGLGMK